MSQITVKETFVYGCHGEIKDENILTFASVEAFKEYESSTAYRLGWEGSPTPNYEIINETEKTKNNESNKI